MREEQMRGMLGLCTRARKLQGGVDPAVRAIRGGACRLALLDGETAANTVKKITNACIYYHVPYLVLPPGLLEDACGREGVKTAAVLDDGFAEKLKALSAENHENVR